MANDLAKLRTSVTDWANRSDISSTLVTDFINIAQSRVNRILRIPPFEGVVTITLDADSNATLPADYMEAKELTVTTNGKTYTLERKDLQYVTELSTRSEGIPEYFARKQDVLVLAPAPASITEVVLYYYTVVSDLVNDSDNNWLVNQAYDMLLYGSLVELFLYVKNPAAAQQWEAKFRAAMEEVQNMANKAEFSGSTLAVTAL